MRWGVWEAFNEDNKINWNTFLKASNIFYSLNKDGILTYLYVLSVKKASRYKKKLQWSKIIWNVCV